MPFSASIVERLFTCVPDKVIRLGGASWLRPLGGPALSAPWERLRFGVLCAVTPNGTTNITDVLFLLGLSANSTAPGSALASSNFLGLSVIGAPTIAATRTLTYTAASGNPYYSCTGGVAFHKVNTTIITSSAASSSMLLPLAQTGYYYRRAIVIVDISRPTGGSGTATINVYCNTTAASAQTIDFRPDHLLAALDQPGTPVVRGVTLTNVLSTTAVTYSPVGGDVDTFEIFWSNYTFPLEISAIGATIVRPLSYAHEGFAEETFESYDVSSGSISPEASFLNAGSGWSTPGTVFYTQTYTAGSNGNSSNIVPQSYGVYVGTSTSPNDVFTQYVDGTVYSEITLNQGSFWTGAATVIGQTGLFNGSGQYNFGSLIYGDFSGTAYSPHDTFAVYGTNSGSNSWTSVFTGGSFWSGTGTVYSNSFFTHFGSVSANFAALTGTQTLAGTAYNSYDTLESYGTGAVVSGVTLVGGAFWGGAGSIY